MKKMIALLSLLSISSTVFAQEKKPFFECKVSILGARDRKSGYQKPYEDALLTINTTGGSSFYAENIRINWMIGEDTSPSKIETLVIDIEDVTVPYGDHVNVGSIFIQKPREKSEFYPTHFYGPQQKRISINNCKRN